MDIALVQLYGFWSFFYSREVNPVAGRHDSTAELPELLSHFQHATGVPCVVIDEHGVVVATARPAAEGEHGLIGCPEEHGEPFCCPLCSQKSSETQARCVDVHRYAGFQSLRFGGRYTYFCPSSLTYFSAPILHDGEPAGTFVAGPVLLIDHETFLVEEVDGNAPGERVTSERAVTTLPYLHPRRAHAIGEMLLYLASWASGANVRETVSEQDAQSREADISGYMHLLKSMGADGTESADGFDAASEEKTLLESVRSGDRIAARDQIARLLAHLRISTGGELEPVKARVLELAVLLSRAAIDGGADPESVFGLNYRALSEVQRIATVPTLSAWLSRISDRFLTFVMDVREYRERDVIRRAQHFIRSHLGEKIGLEEVAGEVRLSPAYLSHIFKQETGELFSAFLSRCRVERSRELLRAGELTLGEISLETGFADQSHFSRVFRKQTGMSPSEFRNRPWVLTGSGPELHG